MSDRPDLRVIQGTAALALADVETTDPLAYQAQCVGGWVASMVARGFSPITVEHDNAMVDRFLTWADKPAWELTPPDVDAVVAGLVARGTGAVTRRDYVTTFSQFFDYLLTRHAVDIEQRFGMRLVDPVDRFHAGRRVTDDTISRTPPTPARMDEFFEFVRGRMTMARKW